MNIIGLIPARKGSKRIPGKNTRLLAGHPLICYTIAAAKNSGIFDKIMVSSNDADICLLAVKTGASAIYRPDDISQDDSYDFQWIDHAMKELTSDCFAILRPTNPFRQQETIKRAWQEFQDKQPCESLRAIKSVGPYEKLWIKDRVLYNRIKPVYVYRRLTGQCGFDLPSQLLEDGYRQTGALQIAHTSLLERGTVSGEEIIPFFMDGYEDFDLNTEDDWQYAEWLIETGKARLPEL